MNTSLWSAAIHSITIYVHCIILKLRKGHSSTEMIIRGARRTDFGTITLLTQDNTGGLRVQLLDGTWTFCPPVPESIIVNVGDQLQRWSINALEHLTERLTDTI